MSVITQVAMECDNCRRLGQPESSQNAAMQTAIRCGWRVGVRDPEWDGLRDYCSWCSAEVKKG